MRTLVAFVSVRMRFAMFVALAVLLAPLMGRGDALAAPPHHDMQMMQASRCDSSRSRNGDMGGHAREMSCCTAMSVGIVPTLDRAADEPLDEAAPAPVPLAAPHCAFLGELATPPPRSA